MTDFSYQLYSSRNFGPLDDTLGMVAGLGYTQVEGYGALYKDDAAVAVLQDRLAAHGLTMPTGHFNLDQIQADPAKVVGIAQALKVDNVIVPAVSQRVRDAAGWAAFGRELAEAGKPFQDAGLRFGWHNHDFEFADLGGDDRPLDLILAGSEDLALEFDVAWAVRGGVDPMAWIETYGDRLIAAHVKDIAAPGENTDEDGWADVGHGSMDWAALMGALRQAGTRYFVLEHDNPADDRRFADRSLAYVRTL